MMNDKKQELFNALNSSIVWIQQPNTTHDAQVDTRFPFTRLDIPEIDFVYDTNQLLDDAQSVTCYDIMHEQYVTLSYEQHGNYFRDTNYDAGVDLLKQQIQDINSAHETCPDVDIKTIQNVRCGHGLCTESEIVWDSYIKMQFRSQDMSEIYSDVDPVVMQEWREWYMSKIREKRQESFLELDQLENEAKESGTTTEDLQDIETIKQMFRDIPQDIDLSQYERIDEMLNFWPSLILPSPFTINFKELEPIIVRRNPRSELITLLKSIDDLNGLEQLLDDLRGLDSTQADDLPPYSTEEIEKRIQKLRE